MLIATTGLRRSEALGVRWSDLDMEAGVLQIRQQLVSTATQGPQVAPPKTARGRRLIRLMVPTVAALRLHQAQTGQRSGLVFRTPSGDGWDGRTIDWRWRALLRRAGLPHVRLHDLRHAVATDMMGAGVPPKVVSELLGHATVQLTLQTYSHVLPTMHDAAVERLEGLYALDFGALDAAVDANGEPERQNYA